MSWAVRTEVVQGEGVTEETLSLRPPAHRVSRRAIGYWTVWAAVGWAVLLGVQLVFVLTSDDAPTWLTVTLIVSCVLAPLHLLVMPRWRYRIHRWEVTGEAVYTQEGWLKQDWRIAPISRIQTVDIERDPVEQLFRLAKITVTTASAAGPVKIAGLDHAEALALAAELTKTTQATPGDAT
ncbi:PH domain-containing protein [Amycolatopsis sp. QT-25]|uniref:PH domain-containing protein n=1 Tax=Amycolatopsis sp. QT-25 TaxID=3034022 RepID=UPI0023EAB774|nr:PH domain-containing protein [Amycolatopsis sp. QT-25]WET78363.1 PH domain-containing protein [Amycolatopsis sp. QT-25]